MNLFEDTYYTIDEPSTGIYRDKGSKFIAYLLPFSDESRLKEVINDLKRQHPKARHWCFAYRLTTDSSVYRINDDGEPSGSAGRPILNALRSSELTDVIAVVVRYFGGTLLGIPGLIHAYKTSTQEAIGQAKVIQKRLEEIYDIVFQYPQMSEVMRFIKQEQLDVLKQEFETHCVIRLKIPKAKVTYILNKIHEIQGIKTTFIRDR